MRKLLVNRGLRMSDADFERARKAAKINKLKPTVWMRQVILLEADRVLEANPTNRKEKETDE